MSKNYFVSLFSGALLVGSAFAATPVTTSLVEDQFYMVSHNFTSGGMNSAEASTFSYPAGGSIFSGVLAENTRGARLDMKFAVTKPASITGDYTVTSAKVVVWHVGNPAFLTWDPVATPPEIFALGFSSIDEAAYLEPGFTNPSYVTDPYLANVSTGLPAAFTDAPWATGSHPAYPFANPEDIGPFPVTFNLDVNNAKIQEELKNDLESGFSSWSITSSYISGGQGSPTDYQKYYARGANNAAPAAPAEIPTLIIEVEPASTSAAADWNLFN